MSRKYRISSHNSKLRKKRRYNRIKNRENRKQSRYSKAKLQADQAKKYILNLSDYHLSDLESIALGKGLNFIPTPAKPKKKIIMESCDNLTRTMRIRYFAVTRKWKSRHTFRNPSKWNPIQTECNSLEDFLEGMRTELSKVPIKNAKPNLSNEELKAIKKLEDNPEIILKKYDKGRGICVMSKQDYIKEGLRQLDDRGSYMKLDNDITPATCNMINDVIEEMYNSHAIDKATSEYLNPLKSLEKRTPSFFMLPKVHKKPKEGYKFIGRPVVSGCGGPLNRISGFLDHYLMPIVQRQPTYLKDTSDTIRKIEDLTLPDNVILASIDIVSMFTSIPQEEAYQVALEAFAESSRSLTVPPIPPLSFMGKLLKLVLYRNSFEFDGKFYLQLKGVPMGLRSSVSLSCLVVNKLVQRILQLSPHIIAFYVYMDDTLLMWGGSALELEDFMKQINDLHPSLKFTIKSSSNEIQFLDLEIFKGPRFMEAHILDVRCHTKNTETWCYLHRSSSHNPSVFRGFIQGQLYRYARNCNNQENFEEYKDNFNSKLLDRGYTASEIQDASDAVNFSNRKDYIIKKDKSNEIPLVYKQPYFPHISGKHIMAAILKYWPIIEEHPILKNIFKDRPIIAYSRTKNLKDFLVRAKLRKKNEEEHDRPMSNDDLTPTLEILQDLETESRGFNADFFL